MLTKTNPSVNPVRTIAPLKNVSAFVSLVERLMTRPPGLPGMATFYGPPGFGKTVSATYGANRFRALYVEVGESWTRKRFLQGLMTELGRPTKGSISDLMDGVLDALMEREEGTLLIIDEFDKVIARGYLEIVREIHDKSGVPIILMGEELMPLRIEQTSERFHSRIMAHYALVPCDLEDAAFLPPIYCPGIEVAPDLLAKVVEVSRGRVRRVVTNLHRIGEEAACLGVPTIDLATWGDRGFYSGAAPARRVL